MNYWLMVGFWFHRQLVTWGIVIILIIIAATIFRLLYWRVTHFDESPLYDYRAFRRKKT